MTDRSYEFWTPEKLLRGRPVFLLGGGPSLTQGMVDRLDGRHVIAINSACHLALAGLVEPKPILFFNDNSWFEAHRAIVETWTGLAVTASRHAKGALPDKLRRIKLIERPDFGIDEDGMKCGRSSGHTAISLAVELGAARIVLLGYDMRLVDGRSHHHDDYRNEDALLYERDFLLHFTGWNAAAERAGVEILNATPGSALTEFPMADLDDILAERAAA